MELTAIKVFKEKGEKDLTSMLEYEILAFLRRKELSALYVMCCPIH